MNGVNPNHGVFAATSGSSVDAQRAGAHEAMNATIAKQQAIAMTAMDRVGWHRPCARSERHRWRWICGSPMAIAKDTCYVTPVATTRDRSDVLQGTLDLMVLKTLDALGPLHGYGIARRLEQLSEDRLRLNEGTVYNSLLRLSQSGWISSEWGASESNRKAKFYSITKTGRKQLARETESWERIAGVIGRVLRLGSAH